MKLGLIGLASMAAAGLLSLMISRWASPLYRAAQQAGQNSLSISRLAPPQFGATGVVPIGYAALAFALGVIADILARRTIAAMAITLAGLRGDPGPLADGRPTAPDRPGPRYPGAGCRDLDRCRRRP